MSLLRPVGDREFSWFLRNASFITFRSRGWTSGRMRVHYSLKRWRRSNWRTPKIHTPNTEWSCFPDRWNASNAERQASFSLSHSLSPWLFLNELWRANSDDRGWSKADPFQRPDRGPEFDGIQFRTGFGSGAAVANVPIGPPRESRSHANCIS